MLALGNTLVRESSEQSEAWFYCLLRTSPPIGCFASMLSSKTRSSPAGLTEDVSTGPQPLPMFRAVTVPSEITAVCQHSA